jgi:hypothetical protein
MILKKIAGAAAIAGALGFSAIGLAGVANAAPAPQGVPGVVHQAQLDDWHGGGWHGGGWVDPVGVGLVGVDPVGVARAGAALLPPVSSAYVCSHERGWCRAGFASLEQIE